MVTSAERPSAEVSADYSAEDMTAKGTAVEDATSEYSSLEVDDTASGSTYLERSLAVDYRASWSTSVEHLPADTGLRRVFKGPSVTNGRVALPENLSIRSS